MSSESFTVCQTNGQPVKLAMQHLRLSGRVTPYGATLYAEHIFSSAEDSALEAVYSLMLPRDGALRSFKMQVGKQEVHSELIETPEAEKRYEEGMAGGHLSAMARTFRDGMVNLNVGNITPGDEVKVVLEMICTVDAYDDGWRFRFPFTVSPTYHAQARYHADGQGGRMELPRDQFGELILPVWKSDPGALHTVSFDLMAIGASDIVSVSCVSHPVRMSHMDKSSVRVSLANGGEIPDRDVVVDLKCQPLKDTALFTDGPKNTEWAAVIPSTAFGKAPAGPRKIVFLLDRSGSMACIIEKAKTALVTMMAGLNPKDEFAVVAFNDGTLCTQLVKATKDNREDIVRRFMPKVVADGGTGYATALSAAGTILDGKHGEIIMITDGEVSGVSEVLTAAKNAGGHCVSLLGIGEASQDRLLACMATMTGGVSRFITPEEDVVTEATELFAKASCVIKSDVAFNAKDVNDVACNNPLTIRQGQATVIMGCSLTKNASVEVGGQHPLKAKTRIVDDKHTLVPVRGARLLAPIENALGKNVTLTEHCLLMNIGRRYGLANRVLSLVAVLKRAADVAGETAKTVVIPVGLPGKNDAYFGVKSLSGSYSGLAGATGTTRAYRQVVGSGGGTGLGVSALFSAYNITAANASNNVSFNSTVECCSLVNRSITPTSGMLYDRESVDSEPVCASASGFERETIEAAVFQPAADQYSPSQDQTMRLLIAQMDDDGGVPGHNIADAVALTLVLASMLIEAGNTRSRGAFSAHLERVCQYLEHMLDTVNASHKHIVEHVLAMAVAGVNPFGTDTNKLAQELMCAVPISGVEAMRKLAANMVSPTI